MKVRLDHLMVHKKLVGTRSQAESFIRLGKVLVEGKQITKPGYFVPESATIVIKSERYVSRAGLKLSSVASKLQLHFDGTVVLDVGSSTGGFTDYALQHGARKVIAVDVGTDQMHPKLRVDPRVELHEKTDIRSMDYLSSTPDIIVIDVSFISLRDILPHVAGLVPPQTKIVAMVKPQFEAGAHQKHKGVIKNARMRRDILQQFEVWAKRYFVITNKADSDIAGEKGNLERFYLLQKVTK